MKNMEEKVRQAMEKQCLSTGYAAPVDILMDLGVLEKKDYEQWRKGSIPYLERVCHSNLNKLSNIMKTVKACAGSMGLKPSLTDYRKWGRGHFQLRFSKSGRPEIERSYATHYIGTRKPDARERTAPRTEGGTPSEEDTALRPEKDL